MVCHGRIFAWLNYVCETIALRDGLLWLGLHGSAILKEESSSIVDYIANY